MHHVSVEKKMTLKKSFRIQRFVLVGNECENAQRESRVGQGMKTDGHVEA